MEPTPKKPSHDPSRRNFVKRTAYVAPLLTTLPAMPSFAQGGSGGDIVSQDNGGITTLPTNGGQFDP